MCTKMPSFFFFNIMEEELFQFMKKILGVHLTTLCVNHLLGLRSTVFN